MICPACMKAADARAPRDQHCTDPKCMCGHRVDRYRTTTGIDVVAEFYDQLQRIAQEAHAREEQYRNELPARAARIANRLTEQLIPEDLRAAGIHLAYDTTTKKG